MTTADYTQLQKLLQQALKNVATKDDLKRFVTKDDLGKLEKRLGDMFATKDDLQAMEQRLGEKFATKDDLQQFATKADLNTLRTDITQDIGNLLSDFLVEVDRQKADKKDVQNLETRVGRIEKRFHPA